MNKTIETKEITVGVRLSFDCSFPPNEMNVFLARLRHTIVYSLYDNANIVINKSEIKLLQNG